MQDKLTLTVNREVIELAKAYAKENSKSLSSIVEEYLKSLSNKKSESKKLEYRKIVQELKGSVKIDASEINYKELLTDELSEKHLK